MYFLINRDNSKDFKWSIYLFTLFILIVESTMFGYGTKQEMSFQTIQINANATGRMSFRDEKIGE